VQLSGTGLPLLHGCGEAGPAPAEEDAQSKRQSGNSESGVKREEERRQEAEELGAGSGEQPLFLPAPSAGEE